MRAFGGSQLSADTQHQSCEQTKQYSSEGQRVKWMKDCYPQLTHTDQMLSEGN
ncbi:hypothetical protein JOB18_038857 [Solea senegalensis]|uniref:Uncharacterized protein n=1 Tax=Solea senegalensis TaxID=28829 RepID=A0AAV6RE87_SOLSE|nr:hypothetical protein JOB18_038857 [Solea senegalensis]